MKRIIFLTFTATLMAACAGPGTGSYNTTGPEGALVSQETGFDANICRYDTGLTIYTQGSCPASVRTNVFTR